MLADTIQKSLIEAMKARDALRVSTLRMLNSELKNAKIDKKSELTEEEILKVVQKEAKKRKDSIESYEKAGRSELAESEKKELEILQEYLPEQMSDEDLVKIVDEAVKGTGASSMQDMGKVMSAVMPKVAGMADGGRVSSLVKQKLSS